MDSRIYTSLAVVPLLALYFWRQRCLGENTAMPSKTVVIIGASWAGINAAQGLLKSVPGARVVLINPSSELFFSISYIYGD